MRGRKQIPTALHVLRGNPSRKTFSKDEPQPAIVEDIEPPDWLDAEAQTEWRRLAPTLTTLGVLTETDTQALSAYCEAWATWKGATQKIRQFGMVVKSKKDDLPVVSPYVKIADRAFAQVKAMLIEFGMTPSSRVRVHSVKPRETEAVSKWAGIK